MDDPAEYCIELHLDKEELQVLIAMVQRHTGHDEPLSTVRVADKVNERLQAEWRLLL